MLPCVRNQTSSANERTADEYLARAAAMDDNSNFPQSGRPSLGIHRKNVRWFKGMLAAGPIPAMTQMSTTPTKSGIISRPLLLFVFGTPKYAYAGRYWLVCELPRKRRRTEVSASSNWQPWCRRRAQIQKSTFVPTAGAIGTRIPARSRATCVSVLILQTIHKGQHHKAAAFV